MFPDVTTFWVIGLVLIAGAALNGLLLRPLLRVMQERQGAVKSARQLAESAAAQARAASAEFDSRLQAARAEIYKEMDEKRRQALERRAELLARTRQDVEAEIRGATTRLQSQAAAARGRLDQEASVLADDIAERVLGRQVS